MGWRLNAKRRLGEPPVSFGVARKRALLVFGRPGGDLLSQVLRHSTIGAKAFDGRVRDGIGSSHLAKATRPAKGGNEAKLASHPDGMSVGK